MLTDFNNIWRECSWVNLQQTGIFLLLHGKYYAQENGKIYYAITSRDARENDKTQTSEVSKYQIIRQPKLDKFQLQY